MSPYIKKQKKKVTVIYFVWGFVHRSLSKKEIQISLKTYVYIITPVDVALETVITDFNF